MTKQGRPIHIKRTTRETDITLKLDFDRPGGQISTGLPFFDHLLKGMAFHGHFGLTIEATGDLEIDPHHLVEDVGIVLGQALRSTVETYGHVRRFGSSLIPMDEALSEAVVDASGRAYLVYAAEYPQEYCGRFQMPLLKEFFHALAYNGGLTLHLTCRYGSNSHHMAEALFKALGKALTQAFLMTEDGEAASTKGSLGS
jgi:imidazoleglycerol-phosphate dehydratase